ncbi:hypothetical protein DRO97_04730 [Archaeoglobales archaeon]|nr:MAG: hypothetical protein DRO97_04730 [Archaeoglobales archaeon]
MFIVLMISLLTLSSLNITSTDVVYTPENVTVTVHYSLKPLQKINTILFGCDEISQTIESLFDCDTCNFTVEKIDSSRAIFKFNVTDEGDYYYFSGVNLTITIPEIKIDINDSIVFLIENSTMIPEMYVFK